MEFKKMMLFIVLVGFAAPMRCMDLAQPVAGQYNVSQEQVVKILSTAIQRNPELATAVAQMTEASADDARGLSKRRKRDVMMLLAGFAAGSTIVCGAPKAYNGLKSLWSNKLSQPTYIIGENEEEQVEETQPKDEGLNPEDEELNPEDEGLNTDDLPRKEDPVIEQDKKTENVGTENNIDQVKKEIDTKTEENDEKEEEIVDPSSKVNTLLEQVKNFDTKRTVVDNPVPNKTENEDIRNTDDKQKNLGNWTVTGDNETKVNRTVLAIGVGNDVFNESDYFGEDNMLLELGKEVLNNVTSGVSNFFSRFAFGKRN